MWYAIGPDRLQYERLQFEVRMQNGNALFLADADRLLQAIATDVARDNQASNRLCCKDRAQASDRAENGYAIHHAALQPGIVIEKANGPEFKASILPQFTQDELSTPSSAVDEHGRASEVFTLLDIVQNAIRTPHSHHQDAEE